MIVGLVLQALVAASATACLVKLSLPLARRVGLVDRPGGRKDHAFPTPTIGGLAIVVGAMVAGVLFVAPSADVLAFACASALLIAVGVVDDIYDVRWYWRIPAQIGAALILVYVGGVRVEYVGEIFTDAPLQLGIWAVPFTVVGTVGVINAINMCDGVDGLAGLLCAAALGMLAVAAIYAGNGALAEILLPIMAAIIGFLMFNLRLPWMTRAKVFLGNSGSAVLGLAVAWGAFRLTQNHAHPVSPALAPWLLAPALIDCLALAIRRMRLGRSPFHADRDHLHHMLLDAGFSPTQIAVSLTMLSCFLGLAAALLLQSNAGNETHLVLGFGLLTIGYFMLTSKRARAVYWFRRLRLRMLPNRRNGLENFAGQSAANQPRRFRPRERRLKIPVAAERVREGAGR